MIEELQFKLDTVLEIAKRMAISARTAPKAKGKDNLEIRIASEQDLIVIADKMDDIAQRENQEFFSRDAANIRDSEAVLLIGTRIKPVGLAFCGLCGLQNCGNKENYPNVPCVFNANDLGISMGSAVSVAMDSRVDNRVMYTVGMAVKELKLFPEDVKIILGIALSVSSKNIFFDRKPKTV